MIQSPPLDGITVLDLTRLLPGPVCSQHLADLGANVIKIEDTGLGDYANNAMRALVNRNKRGLRLDLKNEEARQVFYRLAAEADVVIESFRPGTTDRLGIGYQTLRELNPRLVYCSISGFGQQGPNRHLPGHDVNYCAEVGVADQIGGEGDTPGFSNLQLADLMGGALTSAMGILAALFDARRSGQGRCLDIAMTDGVFAHAIMPLASYNQHGRTFAPGQDTLTGGLPCYAVYRTADDRFVAVGALEAKFWALMCQTLGRTDLIELHRSKDPAVNARVRAELTELFRSEPQAHWDALFEGVECCVTPVRKLEEALTSKLLEARGMVVRTHHPHYGEMVQAACPVKMSGFEFSVNRHAPLPGEHTDEVLIEAGYSQSEVSSLRRSGAIA
ncbi:CaiB/BaiF CoA transferase family protein [Stutzerimonas tarimensis]|uniref:CaiB/BaiF CoA transferase family protein n=1 Tax=Stutzerimonas tarimensis TaxID=1507735 RepID=A0ABV7T8K8_9GAMM